MSSSRNTMILAVVIVAIISVAGTFYVLSALTPPPEERLKVAFLLPGSITDSGWNGAMYAAANDMATALDYDVLILDGLGQVGVENTLREVAEDGYQLVFAHTVQYQDACLEVGPEYPNTYFFGSSWWKFNSNVIGYDSVMYEAAYLAGLIAGAVSNTSKIGYVGGFDYDSLREGANAFLLGANVTSPWHNASLGVVWNGEWDDVEGGRASAEALILTGVDVLMARGDGMALGVIQAAAAADVYVIGDIADQYALSKPNVITSNVKNFSCVIQGFIDMYRGDTLEGNRSYAFGLAVGGNYIAPYYEHKADIPASARLLVNQTIRDVKAGNFTIPRLTTVNW